VSRLFGVELRRIAARRLVRAFLVLGVAGIAVGATIVFFKAHPFGPQDRQAALAQAEAQRADDLAACSRGDFGIPESEIPAGMTLEQFCAQKVIGPAEAYVFDPSYHYETARDAMMGTNVLFILLLGLIGASMIGAEWHAGTVTTLLTWEPRRIRVLVVKALAVALFAFVASLVLQALLGAALLPTAVVRGTTQGVDSAWWRETVGVVLRGGALASLAAVTGLAIASIARNTAFAIGVAFAWMAVIEPILRAFRPRWQPWFVTTNAANFIVGKAPDDNVAMRTTWGAGLTVAIYVAAILLAAAAAFRARDVT
jgi:hypothetical protein